MLCCRKTLLTLSFLFLIVNIAFCESNSQSEDPDKETVISDSEEELVADEEMLSNLINSLREENQDAQMIYPRVNRFSRFFGTSFEEDSDEENDEGRYFRSLPRMGRALPRMGRALPRMGRALPRMGRALPRMGRNL